MIDYKTGDLVERTHYDKTDNIRKGNIYKVTELTGDGWVQLEGVGSMWNAKYFRLAKSTIVKRIIKDL